MAAIGSLLAAAALNALVDLPGSARTTSRPPAPTTARAAAGTRLYLGLRPGTTVRVSIGLNGRDADGGSFEANLSEDGRAVAFTSHATNLVLGDDNGTSDVFVHDERTGATERISVSSAGGQANGASSNAHLSADGRFVAFYSEASNLVPDDANRSGDVFVHDRKTGRTERVGAGSTSPYISGNGRIVVFSSRSTTLVPGDTNGQEDVFVRDRVTGRTERVTVGSDGVQANAASHPSGISADGRYVAFRSWATNLVPGDTNGKTDAFVHDLRTGRTERVSVSSTGAQANSATVRTALSAHGRLAAFRSWASNLVPGDTNGMVDVFVRDRRTGSTTRVSVTSSGRQSSDGKVSRPFLSHDGRFVVFRSIAGDLVPEDSNRVFDCFVHDRRSYRTIRVNVRISGRETTAPCLKPSISGSGQFVAFSSRDPRMVRGDRNGRSDVFVRVLG